jgi:CRP-like cAMP-binding protein
MTTTLPSLTRDDILAQMGHVTIFAGIDTKGLDEIYERSRVASYPANTPIIKKDTPGREILVILRGHVKIILGYDEQQTGDVLEIVELKPGDCFGEVSMLGILNHSATAIASRDCALLVLSRQLLMDIFNENPRLFSILILNVSRELARRLHKTDEVLLQYTKKTHVSVPYPRR